MYFLSFSVSLCDQFFCIRITLSILCLFYHEDTCNSYVVRENLDQIPNDRIVLSYAHRERIRVFLLDAMECGRGDRR